MINNSKLDASFLCNKQQFVSNFETLMRSKDLVTKMANK